MRLTYPIALVAGLCLGIAVPAIAQRMPIRQAAAADFAKATLPLTATAPRTTGCAEVLPQTAWLVSWPADPTFKGTYVVDGHRANASEAPSWMRWPEGTAGETVQGATTTQTPPVINPEIGFGMQHKAGPVQVAPPQHSIVVRTPGRYPYFVSVTATPGAGTQVVHAAGVPRSGTVWLLGGAWVEPRLRVMANAELGGGGRTLVAWKFLGADSVLDGETGLPIDLVVRQHSSGTVVRQAVEHGSGALLQLPAAVEYDIEVSASVNTYPSCPSSTARGARLTRTLVDSTTVTVR